MRHGWFVIPLVQTGDRTIEEQSLGVEKALAECEGKTVLDLGCAEGLLSREFAHAGAKLVHGVDSVHGHLMVAKDMCASWKNVSFEHMDLNYPRPQRGMYDIVLALGVCHKLAEPVIGIRYAAAASLDLVLVRMSMQTSDGLLKSKFLPYNICNVITEMGKMGFVLEGIEPGPRKETVHYYRRTKK